VQLIQLQFSRQIGTKLKVNNLGMHAQNMK
jgi:hypothetical protein